jgi:short-subunit dehydrogenase
MNTSSKGTALIAGAYSGIGAVYADRLARRGHDLILVARSREGLEALATQIAGDTGRSVEIIVADLSERADLARIEQVLRTEARITVLVNNVGIAINVDMAETDPDCFESMMRLNVLAPSRLAIAALPGFIARGRGIIINMSSIAALAPELLNSGYGGIKAYLLALSLRL